MWLMALAALAAAVTAREATLGVGSIPARITPIGDPNLLPQFQVLAQYPGAECTGMAHFPTRDWAIQWWNSTAFCEDPKRPRDVCKAPMLDLNNGYHVSRVLPYLSFNQYRSEREHGTIETIRLGDDKLSIDVTPQYGGKIYAMTDVPTGRSLVHSPSIHQPVVAAKLDAQVDGGVEWNWSPGQLGHWAGTERDVYAAKLSTRKGPMVRVWEFDRFNDTFFQVDMIVVDGTLFAHPKVFNPHPHDITGYWWTCTGSRLTTTSRSSSECPASPGSPGTRVITPASYNVGNTLEAVPWPYEQGAGSNPPNETKDMSWLSNWHTSWDNFVRILKPERPHVTVIDKDIFGPTVGLYHSHPLNGTKFWVGAAGRGGKRWYNWEDAPASPNPPASGPNGGGLPAGEGCFFEPQIGHGPTQATGFTFRANSTVEWTEVFRTMDALGKDVDVLYGADYAKANDKVREWAESADGVPMSVVNEMDAFFEEVAHVAVTDADLLHVGHPYGALEVELRQREGRPGGDGGVGDGAPLTPSMLFKIAPQYEREVRPWLELLRNGTFSAATLAAIPESYQVGPRWEALIAASAAEHGTTHLHAYHLGVIAAERLDFGRAKALLSRSIELKPTALAHRNLAALLSEPGEQPQRWAHYQSAWALATAASGEGDSELLDKVRYSLGGEVAMWLATTSYLADRGIDGALRLWGDLDAFLARLPPDAWCSRRGLLCDSDRVAFAHLLSNRAKNTTVGCGEVLDTLRVWPFVASHLGGIALYNRKANEHHNATQVSINFACAGWGAECGTTGLWEECLLLRAEAKAGRPLTPQEQAKLYSDNPPPYWLEPASWVPPHKG